MNEQQFREYTDTLCKEAISIAVPRFTNLGNLVSEAGRSPAEAVDTIVHAAANFMGSIVLSISENAGIPRQVAFDLVQSRVDAVVVGMIAGTRPGETWEVDNDGVRIGGVRAVGPSRT